MNNKFPLIAIDTDTLESFAITHIDFDNECVYRTTSQNGSGKWYQFEEIYIMENNECEFSLDDLIFNRSENYDNYDKIDGNNTIYDNQYHKNGKMLLYRERDIIIRNIGDVNSKLKKLKLSITKIPLIEEKLVEMQEYLNNINSQISNNEVEI